MAEPLNDVHWIQVQIHCNGELAEALADVLGRFVYNAVVFESVTRFNTLTQENEPTGEIIVSGYLTVNSQLEEKRQELEKALWHLNQITPIPEPKYAPIHDENWMAAWKEHYVPIPIGDKLMVTPAWNHSAGDNDRVVIQINPAMAFGTGTHPTTQLCLQLLEKHLSSGETVIDIGSGSGILSIAAIKLGAAHALAVDISDEAVASTQENAGLNNLSPNILEIGKGSVEEIQTGRFSIHQAPLVMVNTLAPIILHLFKLGLGNLVYPGGRLLLSGILDHQEAGVLKEAERMGFNFLERLTDEDWVALALTR